MEHNINLHKYLEHTEIKSLQGLAQYVILPKEKCDSDLRWTRATYSCLNMKMLIAQGITVLVSFWDLHKELSLNSWGICISSLQLEMLYLF